MSKSELTGSEDIRKELEASLGKTVLAISAVTGEGLSLLVQAITKELNKIKNPE